MNAMRLIRNYALAGVCALALLAAPLRGETAGCTLTEDLHPGGQRTTTLTLDLKGDEVAGILYDVSIATAGKPGVSTVHIALSADDGMSRWSRSGTSIRVVDTSRVEDALDGAYAQIDELPDGFRLDLSHVSHNHFTNDADVQQTVTFKRSDKACTVVYKTTQPKN
jgi:hypothetical protein